MYTMYRLTGWLIYYSWIGQLVYIQKVHISMNIICKNNCMLLFNLSYYIRRDLTLLSVENIWCKGFDNLTLSGFFVNLAYYIGSIYHWYQWEIFGAEVFPYYIQILSLSEFTICGDGCTKHHLNCLVCLDFQVTQPKDKMMSHEILGKPWETSDVFPLNNKHYLSIIDHQSKFQMIKR